MSTPQRFALLSTDLCNNIYIKEYNKGTINSLIDELNAMPYKSELFVSKQVSMFFYLNISLCKNMTFY